MEDVLVWKVDNPHLNVLFEKRNQDRLVLDSWVDMNGLDANSNSLKNVYNRGFQFPRDGSGMEFAHGNIRVGGDTGGAHEFLYCQVGVGRFHVLDDPAAAHTLPAGYDSLYVDSTLDRDHDGRFSMEEYEAAASHGGRSVDDYRHRYIIMDPAQVLPQYFVRFFKGDGSGGRDGGGGDGPQRALELSPEMGNPSGMPGMPGNDGDKMYDRYDFFDPVLYVPVSFRDKVRLLAHSYSNQITRPQPPAHAILSARHTGSCASHTLTHTHTHTHTRSCAAPRDPALVSCTRFYGLPGTRCLHESHHTRDTLPIPHLFLPPSLAPPPQRWSGRTRRAPRRSTSW